MYGSSDLYEIPFLIGVVGHRDLVADELPRIRSELEKLLRRLRDAFPNVQPTLLTSLADGADLLAAEVAADLEIPIIAALALPVELSRADLGGEAARRTFDRVYALAEHLEVPDLESAADAAARDRQFQRVGALVARYSTLLISIWDGKDTDYRAGTARVIEYRRRGIAPADEEEPLSTNALLTAYDNDLIFDIRCSRTNGGSERTGVRVLGFVDALGAHGERIPDGLRTTLERIGAFNDDVERFSGPIRTKGRQLTVPSPYPSPERLAYLDNLFRSTDWLGSHYRRCFTRALRARYALWAVMALLLLSFKKESFGLVGLLTISGVLLVFVLGLGLALWAHRRAWHRKYLDYRALAEGLRVDFYWEIAGIRSQFDGEFAHESFLQRQDAELAWIRAAMRAVSLRLAARRTGTSAAGLAEAFAGWLGDDHPVNGTGQLFYYRKRIATLERNLHAVEVIGGALLCGGLVVAVLLAGEAALEMNDAPLVTAGVRGALLWVLALVTVCAVIFDTYVSEKADRALIRQYRYMYSLFVIAAKELGSARSQIQKLDILRSLGHACLAEHAQWILEHRDKRIEGLRW